MNASRGNGRLLAVAVLVAVLSGGVASATTAYINGALIRPGTVAEKALTKIAIAHLDRAQIANRMTLATASYTFPNSTGKTDLPIAHASWVQPANEYQWLPLLTLTYRTPDANSVCTNAYVSLAVQVDGKTVGEFAGNFTNGASLSETSPATWQAYPPTRSVTHTLAVYGVSGCAGTSKVEPVTVTSFGGFVLGAE